MYMHTFVFACVCHVCADDQRGQKRVLDLLVLELQAVVCCPTWVPETELRPSGRPAHTLNRRVISPALIISLL